MSDSFFLRDTTHALYREHHGWLKSWLRGKLGCSEQAADLTQDTFMRVLAARRHEPVREPRSYLTTIARGLLIDHYRRRDLERAYLDALAHLPEPEAPSPEQRLLVLETLLQINAALDALPRDARRAFLLSQLDGLGYAEIASELKISLSTVKRHMLRAFRACLDVA